MRLEGDFLKPIYFGVIVGSIGVIVSFLLQMVFQGFGFLAQISGGRNPDEAIGGFAAFFGMMLCFLVVAPLFVAGGLFLQAGILHLCLMLFGGANRGFETTFRICCYSQAINLLAIIPCIGGYIAPIWVLVVQIIGVINAHETDNWRAVMAVLLPMLVCCVGAFLIFMLIVGVGVFGTLAGN
jgi:hypothetical protein